MVCVPTYDKNTRSPELNYYIMARYDALQVPRRDMAFFEKVKRALQRGVSGIKAREKRQTALVGVRITQYMYFCLYFLDQIWTFNLVYIYADWSFC
jgi:hypothetical protein